jgi:hypothetical protein
MKLFGPDGRYLARLNERSVTATAHSAQYPRFDFPKIFFQDIENIFFFQFIFEDKCPYCIANFKIYLFTINVLLTGLKENYQMLICIYFKFKLNFLLVFHLPSKIERFKEDNTECWPYAVLNVHDFFIINEIVSFLL